MTGLLGFVARFATEERCIEHLAGLRWPGGFMCSGGGGRVAWRLKARPRVYECAKCHRQASVTAGTVFHRTRTDLARWFLAAYLMGRDNQIPEHLANMCYLDRETLWFSCSLAAVAIMDIAGGGNTTEPTSLNLLHCRQPSC